jgi:hypothetical protein
MPCCAREDFIQQNNEKTDESTDPNQTPIDISGDDALRE